jgi:hypothetical protein
MIRFLRDSDGKRKMWRFATACRRRVLHLVSDPRLRACQFAAVLFADGLLPVDSPDVLNGNDPHKLLENE